jgi:Uma2 family endonuclease
MTLDELISLKEKSGFTYQQIAFLSGVPIGTVQKVLGGITKSPRYETLQALEKVLKPSPSEQDNCIMEEETVYGAKIRNVSRFDSVISSFKKKQGEFTVEDYLTLPDDLRVELIDGYFFEMSAPLTPHQIIARDITLQLTNYIKANKGKCVPLMAPCDVQLDSDDKTMVQPDVLIVCDRSKITKERIIGAPDFIVEVLSESTKKKDMTIKLNKYSDAGVKEYWVVDPDKQKIIVYKLEDDFDATIYGFNDEVPVALYDGKCKVDFKPILEDISFLL